MKAQILPYGLHEDEICLDAKIIAIADVFDAMTCKRVYNEAMEQWEVIKYLEDHANWFDSKLVAILAKKVENGELSRDGIHRYFVCEYN